MTDTTAFPRYQSHKIVQAAPVTAWHSEVPVVYVNANDPEGDVRVSVPASIFARGEPKVGDYLVVYEDGYMSFSPKGVFEEGYTLLTGDGIGNRPAENVDLNAGEPDKTRVEALTLGVKAIIGHETPEEIVRRAEAFRDFLRGNVAGAPAPEASPSPLPGAMVYIAMADGIPHIFSSEAIRQEWLDQSERKHESHVLFDYVIDNPERAEQRPG